MPSQNSLPEGTDAIITGASATGNDDDFRPAVPLGAGDGNGGGRDNGGGGGEGASSGTLRDQANDKIQALRGQAGDRARDYAQQGKDRAVSGLEGLSRLIGDAAAQVEDKVGGDYAGYARRAQEMVDSLTDTIRDKDVDALVADGRELVRRSPGIAMSAAAVVGFALVRLIKAGVPEDGGTGQGASDKGGTGQGSGSGRGDTPASAADITVA